MTRPSDSGAPGPPPHFLLLKIQLYLPVLLSSSTPNLQVLQHLLSSSSFLLPATAFPFTQ